MSSLDTMLKYILLTGLLLLLLAAPGSAIELRLMTGPEQGTYHRIGQEIAAATEGTGLNLEVLPSEGSWANVIALYRGDTEFAIFQIDAYIEAGKNLYRNTGRDIKEEVKFVMPLYNEEIHVLKAKGRPLDFATEARLRVGCGPENSGSCISAAVLADLYGKTFDYQYRDHVASLAALAAGEIDLLVVTAGKPYPLLVAQAGIELVSLPKPQKTSQVYARATIEPGDYPWQTQPVDTFSVRSMLATMIHEEEGLANDLVGTVNFSIQTHEEKLKANGHPKWRDVMFRGFVDNFGHIGALRALEVCHQAKRYGYRCSEMSLQ